MHEASLVRSLLRELTLHVSIGQRHAISEIEVEMGPLSGVEPELFKSAYELEATEYFGEIGNHPDLVIVKVPLVASCQACHAEFEIREWSFRCPTCLSTQIQVIGGENVILRSITLMAISKSQSGCE